MRERNDIKDSHSRLRRIDKIQFRTAHGIYRIYKVLIGRFYIYGKFKGSVRYLRLHRERERLAHGRNVHRIGNVIFTGADKIYSSVSDRSVRIIAIPAFLSLRIIVKFHIGYKPVYLDTDRHITGLVHLLHECDNMIVTRFDTGNGSGHLLILSFYSTLECHSHGGIVAVHGKISYTLLVFRPTVIIVQNIFERKSGSDLNR